MSKTLSMIPGILLLLTISACSSLPSWLGGAKDQIETLVAVHASGTYTVNITKDGKALYTETWTCTQENGKMTGCHKQTASPASPAVAPVH